MAAHQEILRQRIDRFGAHPIKSDAELEHVIVILGAGINLRDAINHLAQRNAAPEIPHRNGSILDRNLHFLAIAHDEFIDRVVDHLFQKDVAAVIVM